MLTDAEIEACCKGNATLEKHMLFNSNADLTFPTGSWVAVYKGRRNDVMIDQLLNLPTPI